MTVFFDMNLSPALVRGLAEFGEDVVHLTDVFPPATPDALWLANIGQRGWILVTRDRAITRRPVERAALKKHKVGAFYLLGKDMNTWDQVRQVIRCWHRILELGSKTKRPFAFKVSRAGRKIEALSLD
ncbi:MAG: DUF5615 family PIN-like protein [Chloroflexi bacterium]|nr:DUF5615 family PIN-like protein [Chloroflexota bacterium]